MSFPYKNPISPSQLTGQQSLERTKTYGTSYSTLSTGGYMEVFSLDQLYYTIPASTYGPIEYSGNVIPITFSKGSGTTFSYDTLTLHPDNISSGRRKLGMMVYVYEENQLYQFIINNYDTLWNNATGSTGTTIVSDFGTTIKADSPENITFINSWTANTIDGVGGETYSTAVWKKLTTSGGGGGGDSITGGTFDKDTETLTLNSTGSSITITGFTDVYTTGGTFNNGSKTLELYDNSGNTISITGFTSLSGGTTVGSYGSFSLNTNLVVSGADTETVWTFDTDEISNGIYISGGSQIKVAQYGVYNIGYSGQIEKTQGGTATDVTIWVKLNGNNVDRTASTITLVANSAYQLPFVSYIFELYPEDYLEFYFSSPSEYVQLTTLSGLTSPTRPDSPSIILVAQSVLDTTQTFTGNTSATCITDLYVENLYGCSPINVNDLLLANNGINTSNVTATTIVSSSILDTNQIQSIDVNTRILKDTNDVSSVDWDTRGLNDAGGNSSVLWDSRGLFDDLGFTSIGWNDRRLYDVNEVQSLNYDSRSLQNSSSVEVFNWESGQIQGFSTIESSTISATTFSGGLVTSIVAGTGISVSSSQGNVTVTATGGGGGSSAASAVTYDNTTSQLTATTVQEAIDEIVQLDNFKYVKGNSISFLESNITLAIRTFLLDEIIYYPIYIRQSLDITHAQLQVTSTAGASSETIIGLYDNGVSGTPTNLLGSVIINTTSNSIFSTAFASPISVTPGTYWVATNTNISYAAYCLRSAAVGGLQNNLINVVSSQTGGGLDLYERYRQSYTYDGSLPNPVTSSLTLTVSNYANPYITFLIDY